MRKGTTKQGYNMELLVSDISSHVQISRDLFIADFSSRILIIRYFFTADLPSHVPISKIVSSPTFPQRGFMGERISK